MKTINKFIFLLACILILAAVLSASKSNISASSSELQTPNPAVDIEPAVKEQEKQKEPPFDTRSIIEKYKHGFIKDQKNNELIVYGRTFRGYIDQFGIRYIPIKSRRLERDKTFYLFTDLIKKGEIIYRKKACEPKVTAPAELYFERGNAIIEKIVAMPIGLSQYWIIDSDPASKISDSPLIIEIQVDAPVSGSEIEQGVVFGEYFLYGKLTVKDAKDRRILVPPRWQEGKIIIVVPAEFLKDASFPVSIGPN